MADYPLLPHPHQNGPTEVTSLEPRRGIDYDDSVNDYADSHDDTVVEESTPSPAEREVTGELVQGELAGRTVYVPPVKQWRASALHALREGDFDTWAKVTLADDDWAIWDEIDPTIQNIEDFFTSINPGLGTGPGNSRASRRSQRPTRRR